MSRSERKRRYRARRRIHRILDALHDRWHAAAVAQVQAQLVGLDFGYPNASVVVADRTPGGQWIVRAD